MKMTELRYFLAAAHEGSLTRAAASLHISQPTLSKALKSLENEIGKRLFVRERAGIKLTDEGDMLRDRAEDIIDMTDKTIAELSTSPDDISGSIVMGCAESYGMGEIADAMCALRSRHPRVSLHLHSGNLEDCIGRLDIGVFDFAVICRRPDVSRYSALTIPHEDHWASSCAPIILSRPASPSRSTMSSKNASSARVNLSHRSFRYGSAIARTTSTSPRLTTWRTTPARWCGQG